MRKENNTTPSSFWWKQGFYDSPVDGGVEITAQYWQALLNGQSNGYVIAENEEGYPVLRMYVPTLDECRERKLSQLDSYDKGRAINSFNIDNQTLWLDKSDRTALMMEINYLEMAGETTIDICMEGEGFHGGKITLPLGMAREIIRDVGHYATLVFFQTHRHRAAINALQTVDQIEGYDHTEGYPEKLSFKTEWSKASPIP